MSLFQHHPETERAAEWVKNQLEAASWLGQERTKTAFTLELTYHMRQHALKPAAGHDHWILLLRRELERLEAA